MEFSTPSDTIVLMACTARVDGFVHDGAFARPGHPDNVFDLFVRRGRLADSNSHPLVFVRADGRSYRPEALVPACAPLLTYTKGADGQVYVVRNYDQPLRGGPGIV